MKNTLNTFLFFTLLLLSYIYILTNINYITKQTINTLIILINNVIPILLPTLILSNLLINSNLPYLINKYLNINPIYILSIITGSPTNASILSNYNNITKLLSLTNYPSLLFIYNYLTKIYNNKLSILLILLNILSNIIIYYIIKPNKLTFTYNKQPFVTSLTNSIKQTTNTLLIIITSTILYSILPTSLIQNKYLKTLLLSISEISSSLHNLTNTNIPLNIKLLFTCITISTTGLCIQTQILSITNNINIKEYIKNRLLHLVIYLILTYITIILLK
jgi:hypothetical protein